MKKTLLVIICFALSICIIDAQHLKFLGIPIDGSITNFQNKLAVKGIKNNYHKSNESPLGQRIFNGKFQGHNAKITVFYNRKTKEVYKVEAVIESTKKEIIQGLLDKSTKLIEKKYIYKTLHDLDDGTSLHYQYYIFTNKESDELAGIIHVEPSYTFFLPDDHSPGQSLQLASYIITYTYEDNLNTSKLTPSTTEPKSLRGFSCGKPENFNNFLSWANNYRKHECYGKCIDYLTWVLDYYKYDCVPVGMEEYEETLEQAIMKFQNRQLGRIKTAYSKEYADVYYVLDETTNEFKYIQYSVNAGYYHIKLDSMNIAKQIIALEKLKNIYVNKKRNIAGKQLENYWHEDIHLTMPAMIGRESGGKEFGDIEWSEYDLTMRFAIYNQNLRVEVNFNDYLSVFLFRSEAEINDYLEFLKALGPMIQ